MLVCSFVGSLFVDWVIFNRISKILPKYEKKSFCATDPVWRKFHWSTFWWSPICYSKWCVCLSGMSGCYGTVWLSDWRGLSHFPSGQLLLLKMTTQLLGAHSDFFGCWAPGFILVPRTWLSCSSCRIQHICVRVCNDDCNGWQLQAVRQTVTVWINPDSPNQVLAYKQEHSLLQIWKISCFQQCLW